MPRRCRSPTAASTPSSRPSASCSRPIKTARPPSCCAYASPVARSASPTGRRKASSGSCSRRSANTSRRRPARNPRAVGHARAAHRDVRPVATSIKVEPRHFNFRYRSAEHFLDVFKTYYGPMLKAFAALDAANQTGLKNDLHRPHRTHEQSRRRHHGRAQRVSGSRHCQVRRAVELASPAPTLDARHRRLAGADAVVAMPKALR